MGRSIFGWSLPPGCSHRMLDEAYGIDAPCEMCGKDVDSCICRECPVCETFGDPECYSKHGMQVSKEQVDSLMELFEAELELAREERTSEADYFQDSIFNES